MGGTRLCAEPAIVEAAINSSPWSSTITCLIEGGAAGVDRLARAWAQERGIDVITVDAEWRKCGRAAGPRRNRAMIREHAPDGVIVVWDGRSPGSASLVREARRAGVPVFEFFLEGADVHVERTTA